MELVREILVILFKLFLAVVLSGFIGMERQHKHRPAGFRTHILVCVGATLTMMISSFMVHNGLATDTARLGAQVISGIGFLGAGTIIRDGHDVRGLTTAATLWAVACVGLAIGIGYYAGAIAASLIILLVLKVLGYFMNKSKDEGTVTMLLTAKNTTENIAKIFEIIHNSCSSIKDIGFATDASGETELVSVSLAVRMKQGVTRADFTSALVALPDIYKVEE